MSEPAHRHTRLAELEPGKEIGVSEWVMVDQNMISVFGSNTLDPDPMHVDPAWAKQNGPYGGTIAFGFLTVSLLTHMLHGAMGADPTTETGENGHFLNYGFDYLRLISPVKAGARVRGRFKVIEQRVDGKGRTIVKFGAEVEIENEPRPALVAEWLSIWMPPE